MELAVATQTAPAAWWSESDSTIATALQVLQDQYEAAQRQTGKGA